LEATLETDFAPLYGELEKLPDIEIAEVLSNDKVITRGTQQYAQGAGR
jgi:phenylalanine-4-hydroxylase